MILRDGFCVCEVVDDDEMRLIFFIYIERERSLGVPRRNIHGRQLSYRQGAKEHPIVLVWFLLGRSL